LKFSDDKDSTISSNLTTSAMGAEWRPSSGHAGGAVNTMFCDGRARSIAANIDASVYARLLTPKGAEYGQKIDDDSAF
jgi:prepilin-type processing-associated H-X9-DG protein